MRKPPLIWLTRPREDSEQLAARLSSHGIDSIIAPVMQIELIETNLLNLFSHALPEAFLLTSRHAAHALEGAPEPARAVPVFCVGAATAAAVRTHGFTQVIEGEDDILSLLPRIAATLPSASRLTYLAGEHTSADVGTLLGTHAIHTDTYTCYRAVAAASLSPALHEALQTEQLTGACFFSARSAGLAQQLLTQTYPATLAASIRAYCLSLSVAEAAAALPWCTIHACHVPTRDAMVDLIVSCEPPVL